MRSCKMSEYHKIFKWSEGCDEFSAECHTREECEAVIEYRRLRQKWMTECKEGLDKIEADSKARIKSTQIQMGQEFDKVNGEKKNLFGFSRNKE